MNNQASIKFISHALANPSALTEKDANAIAELRQAYPYLVPARYLDALLRHKKNPADTTYRDDMYSFMGDWLPFCQLLDATSVIPAVSATKQSAPLADKPADLVANVPVKEEVAATVEPEIVEEITQASTDVQPVVVEEAIAVVVEVAQEPEASIEMQSEDVTAEIDANDSADNGEDIISPVYVEDYFLQQGEKISADLPLALDSFRQDDADERDDKSLMVMMSFSEWLVHFKRTSQKQKEETEDQRALKTMWQKEKLAAAIEEENEEIPEDVFQMAVNSIAKEDGLVSESLAEIYFKQGKYEKSLEMYRKLSLRNPQKNTYFARKIEEIQKKINA